MYNLYLIVLSKYFRTQNMARKIDFCRKHRRVALDKIKSSNFGNEFM